MRREIVKRTYCVILVMALCLLSYVAGMHTVQIAYEKEKALSKNSVPPTQKKIYVEPENDMGFLAEYNEQDKLVGVDKYPLFTFSDSLEDNNVKFFSAGATKEEIEKTPEEELVPSPTEVPKMTLEPTLEQGAVKETPQSEGTLLGSDFKLYHYAPTGNATASGRMPVVGTTVAVDPHYIKLGTYLRIEVPDGNGGYKVYRAKARADDTGRDIKGHTIDVFVGSELEAYQLGVIRNAKVYITEE